MLFLCCDLQILFIGEAVKVFISDDKMKLTRGHRPSGLERGRLVAGLYLELSSDVWFQQF